MQEVSALSAASEALSPEERVVRNAQAEVFRITRLLDEVITAKSAEGTPASARSTLTGSARDVEGARLECEELAVEIRQMKELVREQKNEIGRLKEAREQLAAARPQESFTPIRAEVSRRSADMRAMQSRIGALLLRHLAAERRLESVRLQAQALREAHRKAAAATGDSRALLLWEALERAERAVAYAESARRHEPEA